MKRRFVDEELRKEMKRLEDEGKSRAEIAKILDVAPSTVTRELGAVRCYRYFRTASA